MKLFKHKADTIPALIILGYTCLDLTVFFTVQNIWLVTAWMLIGIGPKACICSWNHHHQHVATFIHKFPNRIMDLSYALHTGITTNAWVLHHVLGHHVNYLDQEKDESRWMRKDGSTMGTVEYTLYTAVWGYIKSFKVGRNYPKYQKTFISMGVLTLLIVIAMAIYNFQNTMIIFVIPMAVGYIITCWHTYYHHSGLDVDDHLEASYNITHKWYNILTGNLGYHTAHHMKQGLHWSKLPELHETIKDQIPKDLFRKPCFPFTLLPAK